MKKLALKYDPRNARKHDERNKEFIRNSLDEVGAGRSILVDGDGIVRAGNGVLEQAQALGLEVIPVEAKPNQLIAVIRPDLKGRKAERAALLDNRASETSDWDMEILSAIANEDADLLSKIFSEQDIAAFASLSENRPAPEAKTIQEVAAEKIDALQKKWGTKLGQVWVIPSLMKKNAFHRIIVGDSSEASTWSTLGMKADTIVTSPPYAEQRKGKYEGIPEDEYVGWWMNISDQMRPYLADDGNFFLNIKGSTTRGERQSYPYLIVLNMQASGWAFIDELCWVKTAYPGDMGKRFRNGFEPIYWFAKDVKNRQFYMEQVLIHKSSDFTGYVENLQTMQGANGTRKKEVLDSVRPSNVLQILSDQTSNEETGGHPARFPPKLPEFLIRATTAEGGVVLDPFGGSGTTLIVSETLGRVCGLIELSPLWAAASLERCLLNGMSPSLLDNEPGPRKKNSYPAKKSLKK